MNIFVLDKDPRMAAQFHVNKHVVKMILESVQMMSTCARVHGFDVGYKETHTNHPCNIWLRESIQNYMWLEDLLYWLHKEWRFRFGHGLGKYHKSYLVYKDELPEPFYLPDVGLTEFKLAMPDELKSSDPVASYRKYYLLEKAHILDWGERGEPEWYVNSQ